MSWLSGYKYRRKLERDGKIEAKDVGGDLHKIVFADSEGNKVQVHTFEDSEVLWVRCPIGVTVYVYY